VIAAIQIPSFDHFACSKAPVYQSITNQGQQKSHVLLPSCSASQQRDNASLSDPTRRWKPWNHALSGGIWFQSLWFCLMLGVRKRQRERARNKKGRCDLGGFG
jgi:hypothetical protein